MIRIAFINREQLEYEREMRRWRERVLGSGMCFACEAPNAEHCTFDGWPICANCAIEPSEIHQATDAGEIGRTPP